VRVYFPSLSPLCLATCHLYLSSLSSLPLLYFPLHRNLCYLLTLSSPLLSTSESLDINRAFSFEFAERMHNVFAYDKDDFWLLFPDKSEASLGIQSWEKRYANIYTYIHRHTFIQNHTHTHTYSRSSQTPPPFTVASLDTAEAQLQTMELDSFPKLIVSVNPGRCEQFLLSVAVSVTALHYITLNFSFTALHIVSLLCSAKPYTALHSTVLHCILASSHLMLTTLHRFPPLLR
jgi:hypothetical protein